MLDFSILCQILISFRYFKTSLSLGVEQGLQKLPEFDINDLKFLFHCYILIASKCQRKTPFKIQCPPLDLPTVLHVQGKHVTC